MQLASAFQTSSACFYLFEGRKKLIATAAPTPVPRLELATQKKRMLPDDLATLFGRADEEGAKLIFFCCRTCRPFRKRTLQKWNPIAGIHFFVAACPSITNTRFGSVSNLLQPNVWEATVSSWYANRRDLSDAALDIRHSAAGRQRHSASSPLDPFNVFPFSYSSSR